MATFLTFVFCLYGKQNESNRSLELLYDSEGYCVWFCLLNEPSVFFRPSDFARLRVYDLEVAGLTEVEINRLVCRLLDLGLPTGNLLPASDNLSSASSAYSSFDRPPHLGNVFRPKPLRKVSTHLRGMALTSQVFI